MEVLKVALPCQAMVEQLGPSLAYMLLLVLGGIAYGRFFTYPFESLRKVPR